MYNGYGLGTGRLGSPPGGYVRAMLAWLFEGFGQLDDTRGLMADLYST
jgi:hypothetical protein